MPDIEYPDIFFTPEYQELFKDTAFGGEPCHFSSAGIDYRFYKRPIPNTPYFDIVSPYGYSGPVPIVVGYDFLWFTAAFDDYCQSNNIIAEFGRLHPWVKATGHYEHDIYYIDLTKSEDEIWKGFDKGCRSAIKGANGKDRRAYISKDVTEDFIRQYQNCMVSFQAKQEYHFSVDFFSTLNRVLSGHIYTSATRVHGEFNESQALILLWGDYSHYFLGTGRDSANLCLWEAIRYAKSMGCKIFNLGGGLKAGDSLESFKRSFTHDSKPFYTYRKIHNQAVYDELSKGIETDYFPAYRAERK